MHLIIAPVVISGLIAKLKNRKLREELYSIKKTPELSLIVDSITNNIKSSGGNIEEEASQTTRVAR